MLPYGRQQIDDDDIEAVVEVLRSDWLTTGPAVERFETALANSTGSVEAVAVSNGTAALHAAMSVLDLSPGDEVIVPAMTFAATANAVLYVGGRPVFADVCPNSLLVDPESIEYRISDRTRAIVAVDYAGQPCNYQRLRELADKYHLALIADACHSLGATYGNQPVGTLADMSCFSFHPVKPVTTGEGGAITTNDTAFAGRLRCFRSHGISSDFRQRARDGVHAYSMSELGYNYRMSDIHAALGFSQLGKLNTWTARRERIALKYDQLLAEVEKCEPLSRLSGRTNAWHLYVVRLASDVNRDDVFAELRRKGIGCNVHYLPVYRHPYYQEALGHPSGQCPEAEAAYQQILSLPIFPAMTEEDVEWVCHELAKCLVPSGIRAAA
ncbi:MAG: UDP-4-amino-4,6-dideoxy-N-acetyl-beta-L-altrosamine transaminase [Pirellulaceae bacterium]